MQVDMSLRSIVDDLAEYVEFGRDEGERTVELAPAVLEELGSLNASAGKMPDVEQELEEIARSVAACSKCVLHQRRTRTVPGQGSFSPEIMFVGEGPGADEDRQGLAFVGKAGRLLTRMIEAMGFTRDEVFIANIVKCRPPGNRAPLPDEMTTCLPFLKAQIAVLKPDVIIALGATAVKGLLNVGIGITRLRGTWMTFEGIDVMPTFHPAYLLRNPAVKKDTWEDLKSVLKRIDRPVPK